MTHPTLEEIIGYAIIDRDFCAGLLNGQRARLLNRFDLTPEETHTLMSIRADSLEAFADQLHKWIEAQQPRRRQLRLA